MKVGEFKVKRNYLIAQMVLDAVALIIIFVIGKCIFSFGQFIEQQNKLIHNSNSQVTGLVVWQWNIIWLVIAAAVAAVSLFMIYLPRKMPKKYIVNNENAQKYSDIVITAITCVRIPALLAVFEGMCIHQSIMMRNYDGIFTLQIPMDILVSIIIIRFSIRRVKAIQPKKEEKKITLKES